MILLNAKMLQRLVLAALILWPESSYLYAHQSGGQTSAKPKEKPKGGDDADGGRLSTSQAVPDRSHDPSADTKQSKRAKGKKKTESPKGK